MIYIAVSGVKAAVIMEYTITLLLFSFTAFNSSYAATAQIADTTSVKIIIGRKNKTAKKTGRSTAETIILVLM